MRALFPGDEVDAIMAYFDGPADPGSSVLALTATGRRDLSSATEACSRAAAPGRRQVRLDESGVGGAG